MIATAKTTSATAVNFGWDFQVNASIVLLVDHMSELVSIQLEGKTEDIEITLKDGSKIYAQAKSVVSTNDYSNVKNKCEEALSTLSRASTMPDHRDIVYITNTPNPLSNKHHMMQFYGEPTISYHNLDSTNKNFIDKILFKLKINDFDKNNFYIRILPFPDVLPQRYERVTEKVKQYLGSIHPQLTIHTSSILSIWQQELFKNGAQPKARLDVTRRRLHMPIVVAALEYHDIESTSESLELGLDTGEVEEVSFKYKDIINNHVDHYEFLVKVITSYESHRHQTGSTLGKMCINSFINQKWGDFCEPFQIDGFAPALQEALTKIVMYKIINNKIRIGKILDADRGMAK